VTQEVKVQVDDDDTPGFVRVRGVRSCCHRGKWAVSHDATRDIMIPMITVIGNVALDAYDRTAEISSSLVVAGSSTLDTVQTRWQHFWLASRRMEI
jgi:hypothetical protein